MENNPIKTIIGSAVSALDTALEQLVLAGDAYYGLDQQLQKTWDDAVAQAIKGNYLEDRSDFLGP